MYLYASHLLATWLADATNGVNAALAAVPRLPGDAQPPDVTISQAVRDKETTLGKAPLTGLPALQIMPAQRPMQRMSPSVRPYPSDVSLTVTMRYCAEKQLDAAEALRDTEYTMLAVERSITRLFSDRVAAGPALRQAIRASYEVEFLYAESSEWDTGYESLPDVLVTGLMHVTIRGRSVFAQS